MLKVERHQALLELCAEHGSASVKEISDALGVSEMTVRRDLSELANMGKLVRVHGGARMPSSAHGTKLTHALTHVEKMQEHIDEKRAAARQAALIIQPGDTVFLGGGTSVEFMVDFLPDGPIRVITCSMPVFTALADRDNIELYLSGGIYRRRTSILRGLPGERALQSIACDKAFIGTTGIFHNEVFGTDTEVGSFLQTAFNRSTERYLVADSSKIGQRDFFSFYSIDDVDAIFIDSNITDEQYRQLSEHTRVICG